jgi:rhodanese-related sulfurtransferase
MFQKMRSSTFLTLCVSLLGLGCQAQEPAVENKAYDVLLRGLLPTEAPFIGVQRARDRDSLLYLDARAYEEYRVSHVPGAQWIGYESFDRSRVSDLDRSQPVLIYCSVGYRSGKIAAQLQKMGFSEVYNLYGGLFEWANQGYPLVNPQQQPTDTVHGYSRTWGVWVKKGEVVYE